MSENAFLPTTGISSTTGSSAGGTGSVSECGPNYFPLHLAMPRPHTTTIEETLSLSTAFLGLFAHNNSNTDSNSNSNSNSDSNSDSVSVLDAERPLEISFSRSHNAQETLCVLSGRRYFLLNPSHNNNREALSLLVCHRFVLRRGEAVLIEIRSAAVGVRCQRLSPAAALPLPTYVHAKDADQWLNSAIASLYETHRLAAKTKTESKESRPSPLLLNNNNEPTSFPSARPTLCTDEPTSRPTAIPSIALNAPPHIFFNQTDDDGGTAVGLAAAKPVYETPTFYYTVAFGGAFCVGVVASIAYCLFRRAQNFIKVPFAPPELAMSI